MRALPGRRYLAVNGSLGLFGDTYPIRTRLKELGARFDPESRSWQVRMSPEALDALHALGFVADSQVETPTLPTSASEGVRQFEVGELCQLVSRVLDQGVPRFFWIVGELTNVHVSRGHTWIELADAASIDGTEDLPLASGLQGRKAGSMTTRPSIQAVLWSGVRSRLEHNLGAGTDQRTSQHVVAELPLQAGLKVRLRGSLSFRSEGGRLLVTVDGIDVTFTQGQLALQRERVLAMLRKRGLVDRNRRLPFAPFPLRVALITADHSRARNDFLHELERSALAFRVTVFDCRMQGEDTAVDVVLAFAKIRQDSQQHASFDAVVVTRGGGSRMDLRWFDAAEIAESVALCPLPVITAIGHHDDQSLADLVAARAEKTPTAAAQALVSCCLESLGRAQVDLNRAATKALRTLGRERLRLQQTLVMVQAAALRRIARETDRLKNVERLLAVVLRGWQRVFDRGFALVWNRSRNKVFTPNELLSHRPPQIWLEVRRPAQTGAPEAIFISGRLDYDDLLVEPRTKE